MTARRLMRLILGAAFSIVAAAQSPRPDGLYATLTTSMGEITLRLFEKEAPITVKNFTDLAQGRMTYLDPRNGLPSKRPFYNGLTFHRVIPGFMIQGGDPLGNGTGATKVIRDELNPALKFDTPGRVGMANAGPNTGSCQFFITEVATPHLDGLHTIFGQVVEGQDLIAKIAGVPTENDRPATPVLIENVVIARVGPDPVKLKTPAVKKAAPKGTTKSRTAAAAATAKPASKAKPGATSKSSVKK